MAIFNFVRNLLGVKKDDAIQGAVDALVRWDPKAATEAELRTMEQHLDQLGTQVAQARAALNKEQKEADAIQALSRQRMAAAEQLEKQAAEAADPARKAELDKSLTTLVGMLEQMAPEVDRELADAKHAREFLEMLESAYADAGAKLKSARSELGRAERDMQRTAQQREMAERQADAARQAAGLTRVTSGLNVALKSMQESASKDLAAAEAAAAKTRLLKPTKPEQEDPNIAKAMQAASGVTPPRNLSERLAALKSHRQ
jgi:signal transduction histidine kinase